VKLAKIFTKILYLPTSRVIACCHLHFWS